MRINSYIHISDNYIVRAVPAKLQELYKLYTGKVFKKV